MMSRALVAVLVGVLALAPGLGGAITAPGAAGGAPVSAIAGVESEPDTTAGETSSARDRPEGNAWIIGAVAFVASLALIVVGRWWVRNRVGRLQR